ncbi:AIM24 family protein, partial [Cylindrospermopsis raciborskii LB2897]|nr:AIM24 family protein [Cylindrospermopsis raciborskii LB2897]
VNIAFTRKFGAGLFGGEGFILQKLSAPTGGLAFLHAGGTVIEQTLAY